MAASPARSWTEPYTASIPHDDNDAQTSETSLNGNIAVLESQLASIYMRCEYYYPGLPSNPSVQLEAPARHRDGIVVRGILGRRPRVLTPLIDWDQRITGRAALSQATLARQCSRSSPRSPAGTRSAVPVWLVTERQPRSPAAEAYRTLRSGVMALANVKAFAIASPVQGEGKHTTASRSRFRTRQACARFFAADLRCPSLYRYFQLRCIRAQ